MGDSLGVARQSVCRGTKTAAIAVRLANHPDWLRAVESGKCPECCARYFTLVLIAKIVSGCLGFFLDVDTKIAAGAFSLIAVPIVPVCD